jgi:hypothetical protein
MQLANFSALTAWPDVEVCAMPDHKIASIRITQHRLQVNPAFIASWDGKPRVHLDAPRKRHNRYRPGGLRLERLGGGLQGP